MIKTYFENIRVNILNRISEAEKEIIVAVYWFTNQELFDVLLKKLDDGVSVELIVHNDFINNRTNGLPFQELIDKGCKFYFSDTNNPMHNKFCVIDKNVLINGSYNWTYFAEDKNRENILIIDSESDVIDSFILEFDRLKNLALQLNNIEPITKYEIGLNDEFNHKEYLAKDLIYKAKNTNNKILVDEAFKLVPDNIAIQKLADELSLLPRQVLKYNIGLSIENDNIKYLAEKGDKVPSIYSTVVRTSEKNQTKSVTNIVYGAGFKASKNRTLVKIEFNGIPPLPKGKAKIKFTFSIDIDGSAIIEQLSLDNGKKIVKKVKDINMINDDYTNSFCD